MENMTKINENICRLTMPYKDIFTTVYVVKTQRGVLLFDTGSFDEDVEKYIAPLLEELKITEETIKYVFISHNHKDHVGGLKAFLKRFPETCIISENSDLREEYANYCFMAQEENDAVLDVLRIIPVMGHTKDSSAIFDTRTKTLISGDCLQLYGIYGSGKWGSNIRFPKEHIDVVNKLKQMDIRHILTAHDYHPYGYSYEGEAAVAQALDACIAPLDEIKELILQNPGADDEKICMIYNSFDKPTLGVHVVSAVRNMMLG